MSAKFRCPAIYRTVSGGCLKEFLLMVPLSLEGKNDIEIAKNEYTHN